MTRAGAESGTAPPAGASAAASSTGTANCALSERLTSACDWPSLSRLEMKAALAFSE